MAITTFAQLRAANRQLINIGYATSRNIGTAGYYTSMMGVAPLNGATGTLAGTSTTTGVVPTDLTAGFPILEPFNALPGYVADIDCTNTIQTRLMLVDTLWKAGAYAFNASTSGNTPTSYASRIPGGDYTGTSVWLEVVTAFTGSPSVVLNYINQDGVAKTSGASPLQGPLTNPGRVGRLGLLAGDTGVQGITGLTITGATAGTFNILVVRELATVFTEFQGNSASFTGVSKILLPQIYEDSALQIFSGGNATTSGVVNVDVGIVSG